jgi:hypothetical protein
VAVVRVCRGVFSAGRDGVQIVCSVKGTDRQLASTAIGTTRSVPRVELAGLSGRGRSTGTDQPSHDQENRDSVFERLCPSHRLLLFG